MPTMCNMDPKICAMTAGPMSLPPIRSDPDGEEYCDESGSDTDSIITEDELESRRRMDDYFNALVTSRGPAVPEDYACVFGDC